MAAEHYKVLESGDEAVVRCYHDSHTEEGVVYCYCGLDCVWLGCNNPLMAISLRTGQGFCLDHILMGEDDKLFTLTVDGD